MLNRYKLKTKKLFKFGFIFLGILSFSNANADVDITFEFSSAGPLVMNIGDSAWVRFDVKFSDANFSEIFLHIPNKPDFFTFWRERRFTGPTDYIYDKIIFKPTEGDGGQYFFQVVAGGVRVDGTIESDTLEYELRIKPFIFAEPEFSGGTTNTIAWMKSDSVYDQWIYLADPLNPGVAIPGDKPGGFAKAALSQVESTTFENLRHGIRYGFFIKGFTADGNVTHSDTVYSIQDSDLPEFLDFSRGHEAPARAVELWWQAVNDPTSYVIGYVIFRRKGLEPYIAIDTVFVEENGQNDFCHYWDSPSDLEEGVKHCYKISALDAGYNVGDGLEVGPLIPDATPPGLPVFHWDFGLGFDYVLDFPVDGLPGMGYNEKTWYKKGTQNSVYIFNPENQPGFENLAKADSVRFQAIRDSSKFFEGEWQPGMQFFEKWFSPWISVEDFAGQDVFYNFDFTDNGKNDDWFIHGHFYKFRAQYKDIAGNTGGWSRVNPDGLLVGEFQDVFAPNDISNLNIFMQFDPLFAGGGYFRIEWENSEDPVSGVAKYNVYRKIGESGIFKKISSLPATEAVNYQYLDPFANIGQRKKTFYRITSVDNVGNLRSVNDTKWEVYEWPPLPPEILFEETYLTFKDKFYTKKTSAGIHWPDFDVTDVAEMYVYNNSDSQKIDLTSPRFDVVLSEKENSISVRVLFVNGVWSPMSNILMVNKDSTPPSAITGLTVANDPSFSGNIFLNWPASTDQLPVSYEVFRKNKGSNDYISQLVTNLTSWTDPYNQSDGSVLKAFQHYEYKVLPKDMLNNISEQNAGFGETYCNIAPEIEKFSFSTETMKIFWHFPSVPDSNTVPLESLRFDVKLFQGALPADFPTADAYQVDYIIGDKSFEFKIDPGPKYFAVVRAVELVSSNVDSSAWSESRFSDTGLSIIPTVDLLLTQAQPLDTSGIFVSWELYWNDPFWAANSKDLVGRFDVLRWEKENPQTVFERSFDPESVEFENSGFMDKDSLEPDVKYVYQVIPIEIKVNDPPRPLPAGNADSSVLNDTSEVTNHIDRVFIPHLNHLYAENPNTGKKYFTFLNPDDSLRIEWFWLYEKNSEKVLASAGDFRGAQSIRLFVSNNPDFVNQPDFKKFTQIIEINRAELTNDEMFYFTNISGITNPNTFNIYEGKSLFLKIAAFDSWGNSPDYPTSQEIDGVTEMILDNLKPSETTLSFQIKSSVDTSAGLTLVDINFNWLPVTDNISGVRDYSIIVNSKDNPDSIILNIPEIPPQDTTLTYFNFEIKDEYFEFPLNFNIFPRDYAGNINRDAPPVEFKFFSPPEIISINRDPLTNKLAFKWTKVQGADKYLVVFAVEKSFFIDENLRNNPGNREEIVAQPSDPDTITKTLNNYFNPTSNWYFRITAINSDVFESGWSNFYLLDPASSSGEDNPISSIENDLDIPSTYRLFQNYPNPFNPETTIEYDVPALGEISISIFNLKGEKVRTLISGEHQPGNYFVKWQGLNDNNELVASGMYLYIITAPNYKQVKKCLFLK